MNINQSFNQETFQKIGNLDNILYLWISICYEQNGCVQNRLTLSLNVASNVVLARVHLYIGSDTMLLMNRAKYKLLVVYCTFQTIHACFAVMITKFILVDASKL